MDDQMWSADELAHRAVAPDEIGAPDEVARESAEQGHTQYRAPLTPRGGPCRRGEVANLLAGVESPGETAAHHNRKDRDKDPFLQIELRDASVRGVLAKVGLLRSSRLRDD